MAPSLTSPQSTTLLTLDLQPTIFFLSGAPVSILDKATKAVQHAREKGMRVIHVGLAFAEGYPELADIVEGEGPEARAREGRGEWGMFAAFKSRALFRLEQPDTLTYSALVEEQDSVVWRARSSAFSGPTHPGGEGQGFCSLATVLERLGVKHLVLMGVATSGIVLSTVRDAWDSDYAITVLEDGCWDDDEEVHRVLVEKVFRKTADVKRVMEFWLKSRSLRPMVIVEELEGPLKMRG